MVVCMRRRLLTAAISLLTTGCGAPTQPSPNMSIFVTSVGLGDGGNLGGIAGADAHCQRLAAAVGSSRTWHAYLSAPGTSPIHARDRIGRGPWFNAAGVQVAANLEELHHDDQTLSRETLLTEEGRKVPGATHDMLTGSTTDGQLVAGARDATCDGWTSNSTGGARVGHHDRATSVEGLRSWNSAHTTSGCSAKALDAALGAGLFYCFAIE